MAMSSSMRFQTGWTQLAIMDPGGTIVDVKQLMSHPLRSTLIVTRGLEILQMNRLRHSVQAWKCSFFVVEVPRSQQHEVRGLGIGWWWQCHSLPKSSQIP